MYPQLFYSTLQYSRTKIYKYGNAKIAFLGVRKKMKIKKKKLHTLTSYDSSAFIDNLHICGGTDIVHALSLGIVHACYEIKAQIQIGGGASNVMLL